MTTLIKNIFFAPFRLINYIFLWSSGADLSVLDEVPTEKSKYFGIGGTIVFTALMASFAGGYAFFTAFENPNAAIFFGAFWGFLIFNLDRYIVSSFGVGDGKKTISIQEFKEGLPRILMAMILGFVISTPLELKIFEKEIKVEVEELKQIKKQDLINSNVTFIADRDSIKSQLVTKNVQLDESIADQSDSGTPITDINDGEIDKIEREITMQASLVASLERRRYNAWKDYNFSNNSPLGTYSDSELSRYRSTYKSLANQKKIAVRDLANLRENVNTLKAERRARQGGKEQNKASRIATLIQDIEGLKVTDSLNTVKWEALLAQQDDIISNYDGFAAHLNAFSKITDENPAVRYAKWLITMMFVFIEVAPILFKMMTERGPYDDIIDRKKHEVKVAQLKIQSDLNQRTNDAIRASAQESAEELAAKLSANRELMAIVAEAQLEIAQVAIDEWKKKQIENVKNNPGSLVTSSTGNPNGTI